MKPVARISGWRLAGNASGAWLVGTVTGHPRLPDGHFVKTSPIVAIHETGEIETLNTVYLPDSVQVSIVPEVYA